MHIKSIIVAVAKRILFCTVVCKNNAIPKERIGIKIMLNVKLKATSDKKPSFLKKSFVIR
jgi:hypothetical protein